MASSVYPSKVDGWLVAVLVAVVASVAAGGTAVAEGMSAASCSAPR